MYSANGKGVKPINSKGGNRTKAMKKEIASNAQATPVLRACHSASKGKSSIEEEREIRAQYGTVLWEGPSASWIPRQ